MAHEFARSKNDVLILYLIGKLTPPDNRNIRDVLDGSLTKPYPIVRSGDMSKPDFNIRLPNMSE